jgi:hypothetical protein
MTTTWTLSDIRNKVRQVTGRFSDNDLTTSQLDDYINKYYQYTFPAEVKLEQKHVFYSFLTTANQSYYTAPDTLYTNYEPPATANNLTLLWYQDPAKFQADNLTAAQQYTLSTPWTGDGSTVTFTTTVTGFPIMPGTLTITDNVETFEDTSTTWTTSNVSITGSLAGTATINYNTGSVSVTFNTAPLNGQLIYLNYVLFKAGRPEAILYFENQFQLLPVPDQSYKIQMVAYKMVTPLTSATATPDLNEWGPCIAYGAARDIFSDYGENDAYAETTVLYKEQVAYILTRTEQDLLNVRAMPNF